MTRPILSLVAAAALGLAPPVFAQSMPDWAKPSSPSSDAPSASMGPGTPGGGSGPGGGATTRVPVDGGLTLLALAGGAYAVRRLRSRE